MRRIILVLALALGLGLSTVPARQPVHLTAPVILQAERGETPVVLRSASIDVEAGAGMAQTTIDLTFFNPNDRILEGQLEFPLQPGQQVIGFALDIDGELREAVPVEKARARQVFETIERQRVDPGLIEQTRGESFRLRVYPLPPHGTRQVRIVVSDALQRDSAGWSTTLPLQFATGLDAVPVTIRGDAAPVLGGLMRTVRPGSSGHVHRFTLQRGDFRPERGITVQFPGAAGPRMQTQSFDGHTYFMAELPAGVAPSPRTLPATVGLLWDASMSGETRAHDLEYALLDAYFRKAGSIDVQLVRLRDRADAVERFTVRNGDWSALRRALETTIYDGATNPAGWVPDAKVGEYLLFGDGLFNYGDAPFPRLHPAQRLFAVHAGGAGDSVRLQSLADAATGTSIHLRDRGDLAAATAALLSDGPRLVSMEGIGAVDLVAESRVARDGVFRVAGRLTAPAADLRLRIAGPQGERTLELPIANRTEGTLAARVYARYALAALQADPLRHRTAIAELGRRFRMVTPRTSLLVLESIEDYVRHDITPPAALRAAFERLKAARRTERETNRHERLERIVGEWNERIAWWERPFPKSRPALKPAPAAEEALRRRAATADAAAAARHSEARPAPVAAMALPPPASPGPPAPAPSLDSVVVTGSRVDGAAEPDAAGLSISLQPWQPDSPVARRLRQAPADAVYALYLDERRARPPGTAFFLDVADILLEKKQPLLAMRVLSNLAEMELENRHVLRVLGYRLLQAGRPDLAVPVLERVLDMAEEEPQSFRDLGLAYAAVNRTDDAVRTLYEVVRGNWDSRFPGVAEIALAELNAIVATAARPVDTSFVDRRLLRNLPLALRAVLSWDSDNSDMDLWVTDPNGEKAYYAHRLTYQGGRMSNDFTGGYGPEEFALRIAKPGKYKVEANFFGERQQIVTGATTLQLWLSTGFGTDRQQDRKVTLRLKDARETVFVGEFEVK